MLRRLLAGSAALLPVGATLAAVFCYNFWSWCCGRCTAATFLNVGPFGLVLLGLNLLAACLLLLLRRRRLARRRGQCRCGTPLSPEWAFCPVCGAAAATAA